MMGKTIQVPMPDEPVDRFELRWWTIDLGPKLSQRRAIYYVDATWREVCPDADRNGADFVNHWQLFDDGRFTGRTRDGWHAILDVVGCDAIHGKVYWDEREALEVHVQVLERVVADTAESLRNAERSFGEAKQRLLAYEQLQLEERRARGEDTGG